MKLVAIGALGALALAEHVRATRPTGILRPFKAGDAATAACGALRARKAIAGVAFTVPANNSPLDAWRAMRDAIVKKHGGGISIGGVLGGYPSGLTYAQLVDVCDAWLQAWQAGRSASSAAALDFAMAPGAIGLNIDGRVCEWSEDARRIYGVQLNDLGRALCAVKSARAGVVALVGLALPTHIRAVFDATNKFAGELELADFVSGDSVRASDRDWGDLEHVPGALHAAAGASIAFAADTAAELASSAIVWFATHPVLVAAAGAAVYVAWRLA